VNLAGRSSSYAAAFISVAALSTLASIFYTSDPDIYWHMQTVRTALATHTLLPTDPFSYSMAGVRWPHKDWLAETVFYLGFAKFGYEWFAAVKFVAVLGVVGLLHASVPRASRGPLVLVVVAGLVVQSFWFIEQPAVFSIVMFAASIAMEQGAWELSEDRARLARVLGAWLALNLAWTWLHRFSVLGHAMLVAWAGCLLASQWAAARPAGRVLFGPRAPRANVWLATIAALASPVIALANPSGIHALASGSTMAAHPELRAQFWEWRSVSLADLWSAFPVTLVLVVVAASWMAARLVRAYGRAEDECPVRGWHLLLFATFIVLTADSVRWVPYLAMISIAMLGRLLGEALRSVRAARIAILVPLVGLSMTACFVFERRDAPYAIGANPAFVPPGAVAFARANGLRGRVANGFDLGGYLLWTDPDVQVLVDGRNELVYPPEFVVQCLLAEHDAGTFAAMRAEDGVSWALGVNTPGKPGFGFLASSAAWSMVYWSETAAVYVRRDAHPDLESLRFRFVDPREPALSVLAATRRAAGDPDVVAMIGSEVDRMVEASPDSARALTSEALYDDVIGPPRSAEREAALARLERVAGDQPEVAEFLVIMRKRAATEASP
jgi:hypothetical protein